MLVILQTEIEVPGIPDNWEARNAAKWQFFKQLMNTPPRYQWKIIDQMSASIYEKPPEPINYNKDAEDDAKMLVADYFMDKIIEKIIDDGEASNDMYNDYDNGDGIFHETIVDKDYNSEDAIELLSQLYRYEEEDSGLWEGLEWDRILAAKAAYTYGNAVYDKWNDLISDINSEINVDDIRNDAIEHIVKIKGSEIQAIKAIDGDDSTDEDIIEEHFDDEITEELKSRIEEEINTILN